MSRSPQCAACGAELSSDLSDGECVPCLLMLGLAPQAEDADDRSLPEGTTLEGVIDTNGQIALLQSVRFPRARRVLVRILEEEMGATSSTVSERDAEQTTPRSSWRLHYDLLHPLRVGGMGRTLKVRDRHTGRVLCLKEIKPEVDKRHLVQECRALARLAHPMLVRLLNFDPNAEIPYLVMEYIDGVTLADYVRDHGRLPERSVIRLAEQLFEAIAYAHSQELIHRDLKLGNIMLRNPVEGLVPVIVDFGVAIVDRRDHDDNETAVGSIAGTAAYMAPEQLEAKKLTAACDVYALGQIMWEMLIGRPAFASYPISELARKMTMAGGLEVPRGERISAGLASLIRQCTRGSSNSRPTADEALTDLRQLGALGDDGKAARKRWRFWS